VNHLVFKKIYEYLNTTKRFKDSNMNLKLFSVFKHDMINATCISQATQSFTVVEHNVINTDITCIHELLETAGLMELKSWEVRNENSSCSFSSLANAHAQA